MRGSKLQIRTKKECGKLELKKHSLIVSESTQIQYGSPGKPLPHNLNKV